LKTWLDVLDDVEDVPLGIAAKIYMKEAHEWRPSPGTLREKALQLMGEDAVTKAGAAWDWLREWCYSTARGETKEYEVKWGRDETALAAMKAMGGFEWFYNRDTSYDYKTRKEFEEVYARLAKRQEIVRLPEFQRLRIVAANR
jgi:hypothetical protein